MECSIPTFDVNLEPTGFLIDLDSLYACLARLQDKRCFDCRLFAWGDDAEEIVAPYNLRARNVADGLAPDRDGFAEVCRTAFDQAMCEVAERVLGKVGQGQMAGLLFHREGG